MTRRLFTRRRLLAGGAGLLGVGLGLRFGLPWWLRAPPIIPLDELSDRALDLLREAEDGVDMSRVWDVHTHLVGFGRGEAGEPWVSPAMQSHFAVSRRFQFDVYMAVTGVTDIEQANEQYLERLLALHSEGLSASRLMLLAFDYHVRPNGEVDRDRSTFFMPNEHVLELAQSNASLEAIASVHPYRADALERLERAHAGGARAVKWLPNSMGIDPASPLCDAFYERLRELNMPLLSHTGEERAVHAPEAQELGNPLRLARALDRGVRVIVAHSASMGQGLDLAKGDRAEEVETFDLFLRMMRVSRWEGLLYGGLSATAFVNRKPRVLRELVGSKELSERLVYASDYPLPAVGPLISSSRLANHDLLDEADVPALEELFRANPLVYHFALLRRVRVRTGTGVTRMGAATFETARLFG